MECAIVVVVFLLSTCKNYVVVLSLIDFIVNKLPSLRHYHYLLYGCVLSIYNKL